MKTWKRALALVLALVMALSLVALPSFAEGEETGGGDTGMPYIKDQGGTVEQNGLVMSKTIKEGENGQFLLTLEAFATGSTTTTTTTDPVDIVLVLDVSGSMDKEITGGSYRYNEVYDLSTSGTYYYRDGSSYKQAYYCDGKVSHILWNETIHPAGWYTENHQSGGDCQGESGRRLTPKTSSADTAGTQFYTYSKLTKMDALKSAVNSFIDGVAEKSPDSKVAVVKFAGYKRDSVGNDFYQKDGYTYNYTQIVKQLTTADVAGANVLKAAVNSFEAAGATSADYGMQHAKTIIDGAKDDGRQKVVVMFTDGEPTHSSGGDFNTVANAAISNSKSIKDAKATVYTIGCFGTLTGDTKTKVDTYMDYVSSNYPNATSMTNGGNKANPANYYKTVSSAADLNNIFTEISQTVGGTTVTLGSTSVLRDVISDSFKLPEGYKDGDIKAYSVSCTGKNGDTYTWDSTHDTEYTATVAADKKTINVTGFSYADNWVDQFGVKDSPSGGTSHGKKLVVEIPIVPETTAFGDCDTNGPASGIYADSTVKDPVEKFPSPVVYIPYFTVVHVASTVNDQGHNEGNQTGETHHPVWCNQPFNLTSVVTNGYLYGGSFNGVDCTKVQTYAAGENPTDFTPVAGGIYYIWEVPDRYLRPFAFWVSSHLVGDNGALTVTQMYLLSEVDRLLYRDAGLKVKIGDKDQWNVISSNCSELIGDTGVNNDKATVYQRLEYFQMPNLNEVVETWYLQKGNVKDQQGGLTMRDNANPLDKDGQVVDDGYITGHRLTSDELELALKGNNVTYKPYWVTLDGVHVEGIRERTYSIQPSVKEPKNLTPAGKYVEPVYNYVGTVSTQTTLALRASMLVNESEPAVENVNVTVVDAGRTYQLAVAPGGSVRDQVAYQAPAGKVFAGWFADQAYTTPADLDQITEDTTIYAKYVSDSYLDLAYSRTGLFRLRGVTLISAVDNPANYQASGFIVGDQKVDVSYASRYLIFKTPANLFGAARDAKLMLADKSLSGTGDLEVTPYWVTLDGTEVHGVTHTLHYNTRTIWE